MSGFTDKVKGRAKQAAGDVTGDDDLERDGEKDELAGKAKDAVDDAKDKVDRRHRLGARQAELIILQDGPSWAATDTAASARHPPTGARPRRASGPIRRRSHR